MSRSYKKTPIAGLTTAASEKDDKRLYNRRYRRACKRFLQIDYARAPIPHLKEFSDPWSMRKDAKKWFDKSKHPKCMRK